MPRLWWAPGRGRPGGGRGPTEPPSLPEAGRAEEPPVEAPACRSPVPVLGVSQGPGEERAPWWTCRRGGGGTLHPAAPACLGAGPTAPRPRPPSAAVPNARLGSLRFGPHCSSGHTQVAAAKEEGSRELPAQRRRRARAPPPRPRGVAGGAGRIPRGGLPPRLLSAPGSSGLTGVLLPCPGSSPEGPMPGGGVEDEDAEGVAELPEATDPEAPLQPQEPRSPQQVGPQRLLSLSC